jgi:hypothetical protein
MECSILIAFEPPPLSWRMVSMSLVGSTSFAIPWTWHSTAGIVVAVGKVEVMEVVAGSKIDDLTMAL